MGELDFVKAGSLKSIAAKSQHTDVLFLPALIGGLRMKVRITYATKGLLRDLNRQAIENQFECQWEPNSLETLPEAWYPICGTSEVEDEIIRAEIVVDSGGTCAAMDMTLEEFNHLPFTWFEEEQNASGGSAYS